MLVQDGQFFGNDLLIFCGKFYECVVYLDVVIQLMLWGVMYIVFGGFVVVLVWFVILFSVIDFIDSKWMIVVDRFDF